MTISIDKSIPFPRRALKSVYPFAEMEIGDSFFVDEQGSVSTKTAEDRLGFKFKTRRINGGCRVWRVG